MGVLRISILLIGFYCNIIWAVLDVLELCQRADFVIVVVVYK